ncbi:50S ribosomal protein L21 [Kaustia mangrovi]|uniref:Large ribosomal subunit protein bL21 n=1 Tax=Kaustia mangrovi TaxID=2593653 RepID=A0A7S8C5C1_9HYPH|nr:50S ribosomal protein L21 [Kaustia mangrovi]QPC43653.1 50S ribosomal protein L21 [Kaustia mangrovi]
MYAVIKTGGKQYKVAENDVIQVERLQGEPGEVVAISDVLMIAGADKPVVGAPLVEGASVAAEVVEQTRGEKITVFKKKRRKKYRRTQGHRQLLTTLRITEILTDGKKPAKAKAALKADAKPKAEAKAETKPEETGKAKASPAKSATAKAAKDGGAEKKTASKAKAADKDTGEAK